MSGLPSGLSINQMTGEITGLPIEVGVFDLNVSAFNLAGEGQTTIRLIVNKTGPRVSSVELRGVTSSSAKMSGRVLSGDGGEDVQMSLFWGETDGGSNSTLTLQMETSGITGSIYPVLSGMGWSLTTLII